jgi:hypothetical protein
MHRSMNFLGIWFSFFVSGINLVDETSELMVISRFGKIVRIATKYIRAVGHSTHLRIIWDNYRQ